MILTSWNISLIAITLFSSSKPIIAKSFFLETKWFDKILTQTLESIVSSACTNRSKRNSPKHNLFTTQPTLYFSPTLCQTLARLLDWNNTKQDSSQFCFLDTSVALFFGQKKFFQAKQLASPLSYILADSINIEYCVWEFTFTVMSTKEAKYSLITWFFGSIRFGSVSIWFCVTKKLNRNRIEKIFSVFQKTELNWIESAHSEH